LAIFLRPAVAAGQNQIHLPRRAVRVVPVAAVHTLLAPEDQARPIKATRVVRRATGQASVLTQQARAAAPVVLEAMPQAARAVLEVQVFPRQ
jgi:hypothetical protein